MTAKWQRNSVTVYYFFERENALYLFSQSAGKIPSERQSLIFSVDHPVTQWRHPSSHSHSLTRQHSAPIPVALTFKNNDRIHTSLFRVFWSSCLIAL